MKNLKAPFLILFLAFGLLSASSCTDTTTDTQVISAPSAPTSNVEEPNVKVQNAPHHKKPLLSREYHSKTHRTPTKH